MNDQPNMNNQPNLLQRLVTTRPYLTFVVLAVITVVLGAGATQRAEPLETEAILPPSNPVAEALNDIGETFEGSGLASAVTLVFRGEAIGEAADGDVGGEVLSLEELAQMDRLLGNIISDPQIGKLLQPNDPVMAPSLLIKSLLQVDSFDSVMQTQIDEVMQTQIAQTQMVIEAINAMTGTDVDGTLIAIANINLSDTGDERTANAERRIRELAIGDEGPLSVSSVSSAVIEDEYKRATELGMLPAIGLAVLLITMLVLLFMRTFSDLAFTMLGLILSMVWITGAEAWLGPKALGLIGPPNSLTAMVPIIVIGLTVDYAIQIVSYYREQRSKGENVEKSVFMGLRNVTTPIVLAAVTTVVSLLANVFSPISIVADFGVVGGLGVAMSLFVMMTLVPAGRTVIDRKREKGGTLKKPRPISSALPGVSTIAKILGRTLTQRPVVCIVAVILVTIGLGVAAFSLKSEFSIRDILPRGGSLLRDLDTLEASVGGSTELVTVLLTAEATDPYTLSNMRDLAAAFEDENRRPQAAAGPIQASYELLLQDWISQDEMNSNDKYDPGLAAMFVRVSDSSGSSPLSDSAPNAKLMQRVLDELEIKDPAMKGLLSNNPDGVDAILIQLSAHTRDPAQMRSLNEEINALWGGDETLTGTSETIISINVTDAITQRQSQAIGSTLLAALVVLAVFFWVTARQPGLAFIAVAPIVLVLTSLLGTMALLGIPYTLITSIITALSIGIGVDYTIHLIHRHREEQAHSQNLEEIAFKTLTTTGSALLGSALTTALGLGVLVVAPLAASQQFGITAAITISYSLLISILVVPPAMTIWRKYQTKQTCPKSNTDIKTVCQNTLSDISDSSGEVADIRLAGSD